MRQTKRRCATTASQCAKKNNAQCATTSFFSSQPLESSHHNQPQSSITTNIVVTTSFRQSKYSHNCTCQIDTQYTAHSIHQNSFLDKIPRKDLWVWVSTEMCSHYWVTPPFDFITAHCITPYICPYYSSHNIHSICLCSRICTIQIVLV